MTGGTSLQKDFTDYKIPWHLAAHLILSESPQKDKE